MNLTKSQKIWLGLLGVGVCALAADKVLGGGDTTDAAAAVSRLLGGDVAPPALVETTPPAKDFAKSLALLATPDAGPVRDVFALSQSWKPAEVASVATPVADPAAEFARSHSLRGVFQSPQGDRVLVDNEMLAVGQSIGGFKLVAVGRLRATFGRDGVDVSLVMADAKNLRVGEKP